MRSGKVCSDLVFLGDMVAPRRTVKLIGLEDVELEASQKSSEMDHTLWPSSLALAQALVFQVKSSHWKKGKVLELGCGIGLVSRVAAQLGFDCVATDLHNDAARFHKSLLESKPAPNPVKYQQMDWNDRKQIESILVLGPFDYIFACDVIYSKSSFIALASCLATLLESYNCNETPEVVLTYQVRDPSGEVEFLENILPLYNLRAKRVEEWKAGLADNLKQYIHFVTIHRTDDQLQTRAEQKTGGLLL